MYKLRFYTGGRGIESFYDLHVILSYTSHFTDYNLLLTS